MNSLANSQSRPKSPVSCRILALLLVAAVLLSGPVASARGGRGVAAAAGYRAGFYGGLAYGGWGYGGIDINVPPRQEPVVTEGNYIKHIPPGYHMTWHGGYNCYVVDGVYYRATFYQGRTVYVRVS